MAQSLVILAKWPEAGQSKTRLAEEVGSEQALALAHAFLRDTLRRFQVLPYRKVLAYSPGAAQTQFAAVAGTDYLLRAQTEGDLGARLQALLLEEWQAGFSEIVFLGTDSPTLPLPWVDQAFALLRQVDVVIGPAVDGGYYLLGCRRSARWIVMLERLSISQTMASSLVPDPLNSASDHTSRLPIFADIAWGSSQVLNQTVARLESYGLRLGLLPVWYDVDTSRDWAFLQAHLRALRWAGVGPVLPHTEALLAEASDE
ncbi:2-phospho-L-lactate guanylyltransferase [bacterium HR36]|nr:2-phospho-L-lactate guanylyltransferase [bacterium HR36]